MGEPTDSPTKTIWFKIEGTESYLVLDYYKENEDYMSPESYEIYIAHKDDRRWMCSPEDKCILPTPKLMEKTLIIFRDGFKWFQKKK